MEPILLAYIGVACMLVLSCVGSGWALSNCGNATVGALKKRPEALGSYIALSALPSTQGLYGFVGFFFIMPKLTEDISWLTASGIFGAGLVMGVVGLVTAIRQSTTCSNGIIAVGQGHNVMAGTLTLAVFPELYAIIALLTVIFVNGII
ncbi:MAG: ATPase [Prevotellaceae bacterium]|jgi:V/A-type H+-transporting ATPase subunit K|nr:ATPase [Prevotellaceae bacterium]